MAIERTDILHAAGVFQDLTATPPTTINQSGFRSITRNGPGSYTLSTDRSIGAREAQVNAWPGPNELRIGGAMITAPGVVECRFYDLAGSPADVGTLNVSVKQIQTGPVRAGAGVLPAPPVPASTNTAQVYWDQPGISPMVGTTSAFAMMAPNPRSVGVKGWWVWWGYPGDVGSVYTLRLYRYRFVGGFSYAQISDAFDITPDLDTYPIYDLTSYLYASAEDFSEAQNDVLALSVVIAGGTNQLRALTQRVLFGVA